MAQETTTRLLDDLDGSAAEGTFRFTWEGVNYELDLSKKNANQLVKALTPYLEAARRLPAARGGPTPRRRRSAGPVASGATAVREWATANGLTVSPRGRIASDVVAAYEAAHA